MKLTRVFLRSINGGLLHQFQQPQLVRAFSSILPTSGVPGSTSTESSESADDFERRIFGDMSGNDPNSNSFFQKLDKLEKAHDRSGFNSNFDGGNRSSFMDGLDDSFNTLSDGMDGKLEKAAMYFDFDIDEIEKDGFTFRPDVNFKRGMTYDTKDLDLTKPGVRKPAKRFEFEVTSEEVLRKADFRNVRFLANFITESGIIIKRSQTKISAKAQRKIAREIKTARAFGLMPFTTMGTKQFVFGKTMEGLEEDYQYDVYDAPNFVDIDGDLDHPLAP